MSIAPSWTELASSAQDLRALLAFRRSSLTTRNRRRLAIAGTVVLLVTMGVVAFAAWLPGLHRDHPGRVLALLPSAYAGFLALTVLSAAASGGGREVVPRDQAVALPVSTTTEHFGALLLAPLNIAWIIQAWTLLGSAAYALGSHNIALSILPTLLWILTATALAQMVGWLLEGVRRGRHGIVIARGVFGAVGLGFAALVLTHRLTPLLDRAPTRRVLLAGLAGYHGPSLDYLLALLGLLVVTAASVYLGAMAARWALYRPEHEELRLESGRHPARDNPRTQLAAMLRIDRAAIWRSVPLRRGIIVLAVMPGGISLLGHLQWQMITILPGLVASGGALLFGVNAWCLDGRGALWRDSLPGSTSIAFWARVIALLEVLVGSALLTVLLAGLRAGTPRPAEVVAMTCATLVVCGQVVSGALRWSVRRPFAVDLRSARATPAPPVVMVGYSTRLALTTTFTGLLFSGMAVLPDVTPAIMVAVVMLLWSSYRLVRTANLWELPEQRARVIATVAS